MWKTVLRAKRPNQQYTEGKNATKVKKTQKKQTFRLTMVRLEVKF